VQYRVFVRLQCSILLAGSLIGGIRETQEMLDFCAEHGVLPECEMIAIQDINAAFDRVLKGQVKYRFVIDMKSLKQASLAAAQSTLATGQPCCRSWRYGC
jgi:D-arabinose 1-dehydrogenase-like Zn-dependent alcohol dehydrogenase